MNRIGLNIDSGRINGDLELLKRDIRAIAEAGFDAAEVPIHGVDAVMNGDLCVGRVKQVKKILNGFDLEYSVHAPDDLNLQDIRYPEIHRKVFRATIRFTAEIGAKTLVYHQGKLRGNNGDVTEEEVRQIEIDTLIDLGRLAQSEGVTVCIENTYSSITHLMRLIESVGEKSIKMCYDFAHSYIYMNYMNSTKPGHDFIRSIQVARPYVRHAHVHDNFGKANLESELESAPPYIEAMPMGIGDLHLPVGWGTIPYEDVFRVMDGYEDTYILELQERFFENRYSVLKDALKDLRAVLERVDAERGESTRGGGLSVDPLPRFERQIPYQQRKYK